MGAFLPINPFLRGLMSGAQERRAAQAADMAMMQAFQQQEHLQMQKQRDERRAQIEDMEVLQKLSEYARPVRGGTVDTQFDVTPELASVVPGLEAGSSFPMVRKADPANTVRYKTAGGQTQEFELMPWPERLLAAQKAEVARKKMLGDVEVETETKRGKARTQTKIAERDTLLERFGIDVDLPGGRKARVLPDEADNIGSLVHRLTMGQASPWTSKNDMVTGDVTFARVNNKGEVEVIKDPRLSGVARPTPARPRQPSGSAGGGAGKKPTEAEIKRQALRAIEDSKAGGSGSIDDAIKNVLNPKFYQNDPMHTMRGSVTNELKAMKTREAQKKKPESAVDAAFSGKKAAAQGGAPPANAPTATNKQTGERMYWDGSKWQKAK